MFKLNMLIYKLFKKKLYQWLNEKKTYIIHNFKSKAVIINKFFWTKNKPKQALLDTLACLNKFKKFLSHFVAFLINFLTLIKNL